MANLFVNMAIDLLQGATCSLLPQRVTLAAGITQIQAKLIW